MTKPDDRTMNSVPTENPCPSGSEQTPTNLVRAPEKPAPTPDKFGGFGRKC
jgi:hypothetical protein